MRPHQTTGRNFKSTVLFFCRYKDAIFASPHKFVGGPGTPGILIAKKSLFQNSVPHGAGGGTVLYVSCPIFQVNKCFIGVH